MQPCKADVASSRPLPRVVVLRSASLALFLAASAAAAQPTASDSALAAGARRLDSLIAAHSYSMTISAAGLTGPGAVFLSRETRNAQFVALGERHGIQEIPRFAELLLRDLYSRESFRFYAGENGARLMDMVLAPISRRHPDSVVAIARANPAAFEFNAIEDLEMIGNAARLLGGTSPRVWGLDQEFGALYFLDALRALPAPAAAKHALDSLASVVRMSESRRFNAGGQHWMGTTATSEVFARLRALYGPTLDARVRGVLDALENSARIYTLNRRAAAGEPLGFIANDDREQYMKSEFVRKYRAAEREIRRPPRVLVKMGMGHLYRGQGPFGPFTVGNLLSELAISNGMTSLHLAVLAHNPRADSTAPSLWGWPAMRPLAVSAPATETTIIDLRPMRRFAYSGRIGQIEADLRRMIFGYDAVVIIGGAHIARDP